MSEVEYTPTYWRDAYAEKLEQLRDKADKINLLQKSLSESWQRNIEWREYYNAKLQRDKYYLFYNSQDDAFAFGMWSENFNFPATHYILITNLPRP
jgi:hypothetical protein